MLKRTNITSSLREIFAQPMILEESRVKGTAIALPQAHWVRVGRTEFYLTHEFCEVTEEDHFPCPKCSKVTTGFLGKLEKVRKGGTPIYAFQGDHCCGEICFFMLENSEGMPRESISPQERKEDSDTSRKFADFEELPETGKAEVLFYSGEDYFESGDYSKAIEHYRKRLATDPYNHKFWHCLGIAYTRNGQLFEAIEAYKRVLRLKPDCYYSWNCLGKNLFEIGDSSKAIIAYLKALKIKPDYYKAWNNLGNVYNVRGDFQRAIKCWRKALKIQPDLQIANMDKVLGKEVSREITIKPNI